MKLRAAAQAFFMGGDIRIAFDVMKSYWRLATILSSHCKQLEKRHVCLSFDETECTTLTFGYDQRMRNDSEPGCITRFDQMINDYWCAVHVGSMNTRDEACETLL